jgi:hypothetical protein
LRRPSRSAQPLQHDQSGLGLPDSVFTTGALAGVARSRSGHSGRRRLATDRGVSGNIAGTGSDCGVAPCAAANAPVCSVAPASICASSSAEFLGRLEPVGRRFYSARQVVSHQSGKSTWCGAGVADPTVLLDRKCRVGAKRQVAGGR